MKHKKPRIAFFSFTGCEGCEFAILESTSFNVEWLFDNFEIAEFRMLRDKKSKGPLDIAFVEGAISRDEELEELKKIRKRCKLLIALGACAVIGGVPGMLKQNKENSERFAKEWEITCAGPLENYVNVDYKLRGCPINPKEFFEFLHYYLEKGELPEEKKHSVCVDCPLKGEKCLLHNGKPCLGPITYGGCGAPCTTNGYRCEGCRGFLPNANVKNFIRILEKVGDKETIGRMLIRYQRCLPGEKLLKNK